MQGGNENKMGLDIQAQKAYISHEILRGNLWVGF
jgi:hypothetical protein